MSDNRNSLRVYVYNDLPYSLNYQKNASLIELDLLLQRNPNVIITNIPQQIDKICSAKYAPFTTAVAIGASGLRVAKLINESTNWFPNITTFKIAREESAIGMYAIPDTNLIPVRDFFGKLKGSRIAIIDDTLYSGLTIKSVVDCIPIPLRSDINIFLLQGLSQTLKNFENKYKINCALIIDGVAEKDVTIIKASGLFTKGAICRSNALGLAFFEREEWMKTWFPKNSREIISICKKLSTEINIL